MRDLSMLLGRVVPALSRDMEWAPSWALGPGLFEGVDTPSRDSAHGHVIDQPWLERPGGERVRLDDEIGERFAVLGVGVDPRVLLDADAQRAAEALAARCLHVAGDGDVRDSDGALADWAERKGSARVVIVRPDRQVYGVYDGDDATLAGDVSRALCRLRSALEEGPR
jgi:3-(3-hydroxy-phenyl)propionate hydroxylase